MRQPQNSHGPQQTSLRSLTSLSSSSDRHLLDSLESPRSGIPSMDPSVPGSTATSVGTAPEHGGMRRSHSSPKHTGPMVHSENPLFSPEDMQAAKAMRPSDDFYEEDGSAPSFYTFFKEASHIPLAELRRKTEMDELEAAAAAARQPPTPRSSALGSALRKASLSLLKLRPSGKSASEHQ